MKPRPHALQRGRSAAARLLNRVNHPRRSSNPLGSSFEKMVLSWTRERNEEGMGRRRQHGGGLALASDQIPGKDQNNIGSGLVTFSAELPGLSQSSVPMLPQCGEKRQASLPRKEEALIGRRRGQRTMRKQWNGM